MVCGGRRLCVVMRKTRECQDNGIVDHHHELSDWMFHPRAGSSLEARGRSTTDNASSSVEQKFRMRQSLSSFLSWLICQHHSPIRQTRRAPRGVFACGLAQAPRCRSEDRLAPVPGGLDASHPNGCSFTIAISSWQCGDQGSTDVQG